MKHDIQTRIFLVKTYYKLGSITAVQRAYRTKYKNQTAPSYCAIQNIISVFETTGSVAHKTHKGEQPSEKRQMAKIELENLVAEIPNLSIRKAASAVGVSPTLIRNILRDDLHLKPYKLHDWHKIEDADYEKRVVFAKWFLSLPAEAKFFFVFSDEAYFYLSLPINKQNNRVWANKDPYEGVETPLHDEKVLVWCGISAKKIYGPFFFENHVNQHNYLDMLKTYFWQKHLDTADYKKYYFQQDGATPHTATLVQDWLKRQFPKKFVTKEMWPPRSPDLNPCDFFYGVILNLLCTTQYRRHWTN